MVSTTRSPRGRGGPQTPSPVRPRAPAAGTGAHGASPETTAFACRAPATQQVSVEEDYGPEVASSASPTPGSPTHQNGSTPPSTGQALRLQTSSASLSVGRASMTSGPPKISLDNFESVGRGRQPLASPRSLQVCQKFGINPTELLYRPPESFHVATNGPVSGAIARRRYEHAEAKRQQKLQLLQAEREALAPVDIALCASMDAGVIEGSVVPAAAQPRAATPGPSPARAASFRQRQAQESRYAEIESERKERNERLLHIRKQKAAEALATKNRHEFEEKPKTARLHNTTQVSQAQAAAKQRKEADLAIKRQRAAQLEVQRSVKSLEAQAAHLRKAQERAQAKAAAIVEARERAQAETARAKEVALQQACETNALAEECELRLAERLTQRVLQGQQHDALVECAKQRAAELNALTDAERSIRAEEHALDIERKRLEQVAKDERERADAAAAKQHREAQAVVQARLQKEAEQQRREGEFTRSQTEFVKRRQEKLTEEQWAQELKREHAADHKEEVSRVRRAKEYERHSQLVEKRLARHGSSGEAVATAAALGVGTPRRANSGRFTPTGSFSGASPSLLLPPAADRGYSP